MIMSTAVGRRNAITLVALISIVGGMAGLAYASVPLYRWFCQVTGFGGTTQIAEAAPRRVVDRVITVRFNADVNSTLPWRFKPVQRTVDVKLGEEALAFYTATNLIDETVTGSATFNVTPAKAGAYFSKIACFCFTEQVLAAGQSVDMLVSFFIDPDLGDNRNLDDVTTITLSYTFFRTGEKARIRNMSQANVPATTIN